MMIRFVSLAIASMLAVVGVAVASHKGAKVYKADLEPVGVATAAGKAKLVDGKENKNKVKVKVKGLTPGVTYEWHLHEGGPCAAPGDIVRVFEPYGELTANAAGNARARAETAVGEAFDVDEEEKYTVNVHTPPGPGAPIACGELTRKGPQGEAKGHDKS